MLQRRVPMWMLIVAVVGVLLLVGLGSAIRSEGWNEGFTIGLLAGGNIESGAVTPFLTQRYGAHVFQGGLFGFVGGIFRFFFFLLFLGLIFKFLGFLRWRAHSPGPWNHHGRHRWPEDSEPAGSRENVSEPVNL